MGTYYKLTDENRRSRGGMLWVEGLQNEATGEGTKLCTDGVLHAYETPELAVFMAPAHVTWEKLRMFEVEGEPVANDGTKMGFKTLRVVQELPMPGVTTEQRVAFGILCVLALSGLDVTWVRWAESWLVGEDRSVEAASRASARLRLFPGPCGAAARFAADAAVEAARVSRTDCKISQTVHAASAASCAASATIRVAEVSEGTSDLKNTALEALKY